MPVYEYANGAGQTLLLRRPVDQRDAPVMAPGGPFRRRTVPSAITVGVGAKPDSMGSKLAKGYYKLEEQGKFRDHPNYLPAKKIKEALALPDVN